MQLVLTRTRRRATPSPVYPKTRGTLGICHRRVHSPALRTPDCVTEWGRASAALRSYACVRAGASASASVNVRAFVGGCGRDDARAREAERAARARARCMPGVRDESVWDVEPLYGCGNENREMFRRVGAPGAGVGAA